MAIMNISYRPMMEPPRHHPACNGNEVLQKLKLCIIVMRMQTSHALCI